MHRRFDDNRDVLGLDPGRESTIAIAWRNRLGHRRRNRIARGRVDVRWVTVLTERGPRACGVWQGEYVDVNAADPEMPASVRELLELGPGWQRRAWETLA